MSAKRKREADFEQRVVDRMRLIMRAENVAPGTTFNAAWSDAEIRAKAVSAALGPAAIDGKDATYIEARFDHLADQAPVDPVRLALMTQPDRRH